MHERERAAYGSVGLFETEWSRSHNLLVAVVLSCIRTHIRFLVGVTRDFMYRSMPRVLFGTVYFLAYFHFQQAQGNILDEAWIPGPLLHGQVPFSWASCGRHQNIMLCTQWRCNPWVDGPTDCLKVHGGRHTATAVIQSLWDYNCATRRHLE